MQRYKDAEAQRFKNLAPQNLSILEPLKKTGKITVVVYPPWTREVAGSNPASQTKWKYAKAGELGRSEMKFFIQRNQKNNKNDELNTVVFD